MITIGEMPNIYGEFPCVVPTNHNTYTKGNFYGTSYVGATNSAGQTISMPTSNTSSDNAWGYGLNIGENKSHNNLQPYLSVFMFKRTA